MARPIIIALALGRYTRLDKVELASMNNVELDTMNKVELASMNNVVLSKLELPLRNTRQGE